MKLPSVNLSTASLAALTEATAAINSSLDMDEVLNSIATSAANVMRAEASSVLLLDSARHKLVFVAAVGDRGTALIGEEFDASLGIAGFVARTATPTKVTDAHTDERFFRGIDDMSSFQTRGLIAAPMTHESQVVGVVEVLNRSDGQEFTQADLDLLQVFANLAAAAAQNAKAHQNLRRQNIGLREAVLRADKMIGDSPAIHHVLTLCEKVAGSNATVLLLGETGTGKEVTARHLHAQSSRRDKPFIGVNCAALTETLLESELFGHEKGAFTGATTQRIGRFEMAHQGTLFLDEIGDISQSTQVKLLRVLEQREFVRVGGAKTVACDVRIIAATNRDLQKALAEGTFREDLFYRLNVFPIELPPLRQRREDIAPLAEHFMQRASLEMGRPLPKLSAEVAATLTAHTWRGNIRELKNVIERAVLMCDGQEIALVHLPRDIAGDSEAGLNQQGDSSLWGYERAMIVKALNEAAWNQSQAARALGISRDNLRYRIKKYNIEKPA